jgi:hypothetical protein
MPTHSHITDPWTPAEHPVHMPDLTVQRVEIELLKPVRNPRHRSTSLGTETHRQPRHTNTSTNPDRHTRHKPTLQHSELRELVRNTLIIFFFLQALFSRNHAAHELRETNDSTAYLA